MRITIDQPQPSTALEFFSFAFELHFECLQSFELNVKFTARVFAQELIGVAEIPRH